MFDLFAPFSTQLQQYQRSVLGAVILSAQDRSSTIYAYQALVNMRRVSPSMPPLPELPGR